MGISSVKGGSVGSFNPTSFQSPVGGAKQVDSTLKSASAIAEKLQAGDVKGAVEEITKLAKSLGIDPKKILEALGLNQEGQEGAAPAGAAQGGGQPQGAQQQGEGADALGDVFKLLSQVAQQNPELAKKLLQNPDLLKKLAENPDLLKKVAQNPQALEGLAAGAPPELTGASSFQAQQAAAPVNLG